MKTFNSVWVATVPRTGSMWTTNVIKEIFKCKNFLVFPDKQLVSDLDWLNFYKTDVLFSQNNLNRFVLKIHEKLTKIPPRSKLVTNLRNPYDVCASYYEFMKCSLNESIKLAQSLRIFVNHYKSLSDNVFTIKYEEIETQPKELIKKLAIFCEVLLSEVEINQICKKYEKKEIKKLIDKNDSLIASNQTLNNDSFKVLKLKDGNLRSFDLKTGFQTGHISSRNTGEWKKIFSNQEIDEIIEKLDPITIELGYSSEKN